MAVAFAVVTVALFAVSVHSYIIFHTLAEMFAVVVAFAAFGVAWYSRRWIGANFLLMLGVGYLFVGLTDLVHMLTYKGLNIVPGATTNTPTQFWLTGRGLEAVAFVIAVSRPMAKFSLPRVVIGFCVVTVALAAAVVTGLFPVAYVDGQGLTPFKVAAEYVIIAAYLAAYVALRRNPTGFDPLVRELLMVSLVVKVTAELCFTLYVDVYGLSNFAGHILKIVSYYLFLRAIVETGLTRPQALIFGSIEREKELAGEVQRHATTLDAVLDASLDPVVMIDRDGRFQFVSLAGERLFGRPADQLTGQRWRDVGLAAGIMTPIDRLCRRVLDSGVPITEECRVPGEEGERCLEVQVAPVRGPEGAPSSAVVVVVRDITQRKDMEEDLTASLENNRVLMMEVHHRVKNNLQIVSSLLQMQGWQVGDPRMRSHFDEACGRILSLAKVHEMLYKQDNVASIDFVSYARTLCAELFKMYGVRDDWVSLKFESGSLALALDKAVPLALIVHELVANAVKHAFTEKGGELRLAVVAEGDTGVLKVADDGLSGVAIGAENASLGMRMVAVLVKQIHGTLSETRGRGTEVVVRFPLAEPAALAADEPAMMI